MPKAFRWTYCFVSGTAERILFALPLVRLFFVGLLALLFGLAVLLNPEWLGDEPRFLVLLAGGSGVMTFVILLVVVATHRGGLKVDAASRSVHLEFQNLFGRTDWSRPFEAFSKVRTRQVKDMHGLHNHWKIELVTDDGTCLMVGHGLIGTIRKRSRDRLCGLLADMLGVPVEHAPKE